MMTMEDTIRLFTLLVYILQTRTQHLLPSGNEKMSSSHIFKGTFNFKSKLLI